MIFTSAGLGPIPLGSPEGGALVAMPCEVYTSPLLDLTVEHRNIEVIPTKEDHIARLMFAFWIVEEKSGVQSSPAHARAGTNEDHDNIYSLAAPSNNGVNDADPPSLTAIDIGLLFKTLIPGVPVFFDVTTPAAGTDLVVRAKFVIVVQWISFN